MKGWRRFCLIVLISGVILRFYNLSGQLYWHDEAFTSLRISGYTAEEVKQEIFTGELIQVKDLQKYQNSNRDRNISHVIDALALEDSQHPPLYYILIKLWADWFGSSIPVIRSFSALISLLVFPCLYWLCWELFRSPLVGWMAIAIASVSPYFFLYAREARQYSLWTVTILLTGILLLRSIRLTREEIPFQQSFKNWGGYAIALTFSFYTFPISAIVAIGQGIYVLIAETLLNRFHRFKSLLFYSFASCFSILLFSPWVAIMISSWSKTGPSWTERPLPLLIWLKLWGMHFSRFFIFSIDGFGFHTLLNYITLPIFILLFLYSLYFLCRQTPVKVWLFILILTLIIPFALASPDLLWGGQRSTSSRYLLPMYLGMDIAIAYLFTAQILQSRFWPSFFWKSITLATISLGLISCLFYVNAEASWIKGVSFNNPEIVRAIAPSSKSLLITTSAEINFGNILALSHVLDPNINLLLIDVYAPSDWEIIAKIPESFQNIYFLNVSDRWRQKFENQYNFQTKPIYSDTFLWLWQKNQKFRSMGVLS
ncbi:MAG: glycosyltransferase family 39 protein [Cyanobacteria bacterium SBLK]|nr:glycosyltransferase family 39 protein [Cyanobacteria bacterium SBLK]